MTAPDKPVPKKKFVRKKPSDDPLFRMDKAQLLTKARHLTTELLIIEWATTQPDMSPREFLMTVKGFTEPQYKDEMGVINSSEWYVRKKKITEGLVAATLRDHVGMIASMNDTHIKAAKLGLAKAIDMMTRMKIEEKRDKKGNIFFAGFKPSDLKSCLESISLAQRVQRMALGLPTTDGSITAWQKVQHERTTETAINPADGSVVEKVTETATVEQQVQKLEDALSYDDIRLLIEAEKRRQGAVIDTTAKPVSPSP